MPVYRLTDYLGFPDPEEAEDGLLAFGGDLSRERLILAYKCGIFPWYSPDNPIMWWSPNPRPVFYPDKLYISKSLRKALREPGIEVRFDTNFKQVMEHCGNTPRKDGNGTWVSDEIIAAYCDLHQFGIAHSVEVYYNNQLVGGLFGESIGKAFFGESMFSLRSNASKIALVHLCELLKEWNFHFVDAQVTNPHLLSLGAKELPREQFLDMLEESNREETLLGKWSENIVRVTL